jgi:hypothetical protein
MEDHAAQIVRLRSQLEQLTYRLESLGAAARLTQRGRIEMVRQRLRVLTSPPAAANPIPDA